MSRVLLVGPSLDLLGGQSVQAAALVRNLRNEPSVEISFLAINPRLPGVLRRLQSIKYVRTVVTSAVYVSRLLRRVPRTDIVHVFSASHLSFVIAPTPAILIAKCCRKAVVLHYHSGEADLHLRRWHRTAARTMRLVDVIVVPSRYLEEQFARHGLSVRLIVNVIESGRSSLRKPRPRQPVLLSNRQLLPHCHVASILRAFELVQRRFTGARLIVAGDGSDRRGLERLARRLRLRQIEFVGWVPHARMAEVYAAADVYLNASDDGDNVPVSILEAFAAGLPVVSTDAAGIPELVRTGETGMLVRHGDHAALAACAMRLLDDPGLASELTRNAHQECRRYAWSAVRDEWLAVYGELS